MALSDFLLGPAFIVGIIVVLFVVILIASGIRVIKEWERAPLLRLGRFTGLNIVQVDATMSTDGRVASI